MGQAEPIGYGRPTKLEQYDYAGATGIAVVMLVASFILLLCIHVLQCGAGTARHRRSQEMSGTFPIGSRELSAPQAPSMALIEPRFVRWLLIASALAFLLLFLFLPLVAIRFCA